MWIQPCPSKFISHDLQILPHCITQLVTSSYSGTFNAILFIHYKILYLPIHKKGLSCFHNAKCKNVLVLSCLSVLPSTLLNNRFSQVISAFEMFSMHYQYILTYITEKTAVSIFRESHTSTCKMETAGCSKTSVHIFGPVKCHVPQHRNLRIHNCEKPQLMFTWTCILPDSAPSVANPCISMWVQWTLCLQFLALWVGQSPATWSAVLTVCMLTFPAE